jgi:probable phosphoglycerate mutase
VPSKFTFPNGESFKSLRRRVDLIFKAVSKEKGPLMFVTHGDVIKMALSIASNSKLDDFQRFIVEPGSISTINYGLTKSSIISSNNFAPKSIVNVVNQVALGGGDIIKKLRWFRR